VDSMDGKEDREGSSSFCATAKVTVTFFYCVPRLPVVP
jgi:hypothetical protein